jgi:hypothetical protein
MFVSNANIDVCINFVKVIGFQDSC